MYFREISLRISAIRETFEELGLLSGKNSQQLRAKNPFSVHRREFDIVHWQNEVMQNIIHSRFHVQNFVLYQ